MGMKLKTADRKATASACGERIGLNPIKRHVWEISPPERNPFVILNTVKVSYSQDWTDIILEVSQLVYSHAQKR